MDPFYPKSGFPPGRYLKTNWSKTKVNSRRRYRFLAHPKYWYFLAQIRTICLRFDRFLATRRDGKSITQFEAKRSHKPYLMFHKKNHRSRHPGELLKAVCSGFTVSKTKTFIFKSTPTTTLFATHLAPNSILDSHLSNSPPCRLGSPPSPACGTRSGPAQEGQSRLKVPLQEKFGRGILKGVRNISDTLENNGIKFLL